MAKLNEIASRPGYNGAASSASKATIIVFVGTFIYLVFFSGVSPGLLGGAVFFFIGIFAVSLIVSMPLFLFRTKAPRLGFIIVVADIALTIFLTRTVYLRLFTEIPVSGTPFVVTCSEPMPEFSLGLHSNPSKPEVQQLCACIWGNLSGWERETAQAIAKGREGEVSAVNMRAFPSRFGQALKKCGGMNM